MNGYAKGDGSGVNQFLFNHFEVNAYQFEQLLCYYL